VLEGRLLSPMTAQRDMKRVPIVLLAAEGRSTRSIAKEVGVQPRIVSDWRRRFSEEGLEVLEERPRPGKAPIYGAATNKRILKLLDRPAPKGYARLTGPLLAEPLGDVDVQYVSRFLRAQKIDLSGLNPDARATILRSRPRQPMSSASKPPRPTNRLSCASMRSPRSGCWSERRAISNCPKGRR
jgi:transposase